MLWSCHDSIDAAHLLPLPSLELFHGSSRAVCAAMSLQWCWQTTAWCVKGGIKGRFWQAAVSHVFPWTVPAAHVFSFLNSMAAKYSAFSCFFGIFWGVICMTHFGPSVFGRSRRSGGHQVAHSPLGTIIPFSHQLHWNLNHTWSLSLFHLQFFTQNGSVSTTAPKLSLTPTKATTGCCIIHLFFPRTHKMGE